MLATLAPVLLGAALFDSVAGHASIWHPSMWGYNVTLGTFPYDNRPFAPLQNYTFNEWWFHGHLAYPPNPGDVYQLVAGAGNNFEIACSKAWTTFGKTKNTVLTDYPCPGSTILEFHTTSQSDTQGCGLAIAYKSDVSQVKPSDLTIFSVNHTCVWTRNTLFQVPKAMPACPPGGCICSWHWIHAPDAGSEQMYMTGFRCNITNPTSKVPLAPAKIARRCGYDSLHGKNYSVPSNCTYGAKQPLYWDQFEGNTFFESVRAPPYYNDLYNFKDGAQNDIFNNSKLPTFTSYSTGWPITYKATSSTPKPTTTTTKATTTTTSMGSTVTNSGSTTNVTTMNRVAVVADSGSEDRSMRWPHGNYAHPPHQGVDDVKQDLGLPSTSSSMDDPMSADNSNPDSMSGAYSTPGTSDPTTDGSTTDSFASPPSADYSTPDANYNNPPYTGSSNPGSSNPDANFNDVTTNFAVPGAGENPPTSDADFDDITTNFAAPGGESPPTSDADFDDIPNFADPNPNPNPPSTDYSTPDSSYNPPSPNTADSPPSNGYYNYEDSTTNLVGVSDSGNTGNPPPSSGYPHDSYYVDPEGYSHPSMGSKKRRFVPRWERDVRL